MDFSGFEVLFKENLETRLLLFICAVFLIFINWGIETIKWKYLIKNIENLSFIKAFSAIMAGVAISSLTPNRVGEFAGRMMFLKNKLDSRVIALTIIGSMSQLMITMIIGLPGFLLYLADNDISGLVGKQWIQGFVLIIPLIYILIFWNLPLIFRKFKTRFKNNKYVIYITESSSFLNRPGLLYISILSFLRYLIFASQYVLILLFFDISLLWWQYLVFVPAIFFIQSVIPSFAIADIGIRITVAVTLLSFTNLPQIQIIAASSMLWAINLMIPAALGVIALLFTKINKA